MTSTRSSVKATPSSATRPTVARFEERRRARRRRRLLELAIALLVVAVVGTSVWAVWFSSWFTVTRVEVVGNHRLTVTQIEDVARVPLGRPVVRVDTTMIQRHVAGLTVVSSVVVSTSWPHTVRIAVVERKPVAVLRAAGGTFRLVDVDGVDLGGVSTRPVGLPLLSMDLAADHASVRAAATVAASLTPTLEAKVRWISALTANSVVLQLSSGAAVRWGDSSQGAIKAKVLVALMKRGANVYDVSAPYAPTTGRG